VGSKKTEEGYERGGAHWGNEKGASQKKEWLYGRDMERRTSQRKKQKKKSGKLSRPSTDEDLLRKKKHPHPAHKPKCIQTKAGVLPRERKRRSSLPPDAGGQTNKGKRKKLTPQTQMRRRGPRKVSRLGKNAWEKQAENKEPIKGGSAKTKKGKKGNTYSPRNGSGNNRRAGGARGHMGNENKPIRLKSRRGGGGGREKEGTRTGTTNTPTSPYYRVSQKTKKTKEKRADKNRTRI